jgi:hypothetical protein
MEVMGAAQDDEEEAPQTFRSAKRALYDENKAGTITPRDRKALRERAQSMAHEQRGVERKVQKRVSEEEDEVVRNRKPAGEKKDWEFI